MTVAIPRPDAPSSQTSSGHLFGPVSDFMWLGGVTLIIFPILAILPADPLRGGMATTMFLLANVINHPHFAVSYRIFYQDFGRKISADGSTDKTLRWRYMFAGIVAPIGLTIAMMWPFLASDAELLGDMYHIMIFFVGWHYVKQGYGMAMVDAAMKKQFFDNREKKILLANAYAVWITSWMTSYRSFTAEDYWGVPLRGLPFSGVLFGISIAALVVTSILTAAMLAKRYLTQVATPWSGTVAYLASLYAWLLLIRISPLLLLVTPALHSLQYLWVVRRFQINRNEADGSQLSFTAQYWRSFAMGLAMFLAIPMTLDVVVGYDDAQFGTTPFTFIFLIFINVHHYFLDNVMWRRGNPEVSKHLFASAR